MINHEEACNVQTTHQCTCRPGVDPERLRAAIRLLYPDDITPTAKRMLERVIDDAERDK